MPATVKKAGRPKGSKNKPKMTVLEERELRERIKLLKLQQEQIKAQLDDDFLTGLLAIDDVEVLLETLLERGWQLITSPIGKRLVLSALFIYLWKEYGEDKTLRKNDILFGLTMGFTVPEALQGDQGFDSFNTWYLAGTLTPLCIDLLGFPDPLGALGEAWAGWVQKRDKYYADVGVVSTSDIAPEVTFGLHPQSISPGRRAQMRLEQDSRYQALTQEAAEIRKRASTLQAQTGDSVRLQEIFKELNEIRKRYTA